MKDGLTVKEDGTRRDTLTFKGFEFMIDLSANNLVFEGGSWKNFDQKNPLRTYF